MWQRVGVRVRRLPNRTTRDEAVIRPLNGETPVQIADRIKSRREAENIIEYYVDVDDQELAEFWRDVARILADRELPAEDLKPRPKAFVAEPGGRVIISREEWRGEHGRILGVSPRGVTIRLDSGSIVNLPPSDLHDE